MKINTVCPICGNNKFNLKFSGFDYIYNIRDKSYDIIECQECGLRHIYPLPSKKEQLHFYPDDYYSYHLKDNKKSLYDFCILAEHWIFSIFDNRNIKLPKYSGDGKNFLDVGCGDGKNLELMKNKGWNVNGFEISDKEYLKNDIYYGSSICDVDFEKKFDFIRCNQVLEHVDNPIEFLEKLKSILKNDGTLVINLPNTKSLSCLILGKYDVSLDIPRHIYGYNFSNIQLLFEKLGFKIVHKYKCRQGGIAGAIAGAITTRYNKSIRGTIWYFILLLLCVPIEFVLSCLKLTNSMGFVLKK